MSMIKVLICEHETFLHQALKDGFQAIFEKAGRRADIKACDQIDTAYKALLNEDFDVLVSDLQFGEDIAVGLDFIKNVKRDKPQVFVMACSRTNPDAEILLINRPSYDQFVPKRWITAPVDRDIELIAAQFKRRFHRFTGFTLRIEGEGADSLSIRGEPLSHRELTSLVAQAYADLDLVDPSFRPAEITLEPITGGYSGSLVFRVAMQASNRSLRFVPTVLKVSRQAWAQQERDNFNRFAKWMLPFTKRTEMVGYGETKAFGAIAHAFVMGGDEAYTSLTTHLEDRASDKVAALITHIFDGEQVSFYQNTRQVSSDSAAQHYRARYFPDERYEENKRCFVEAVRNALGGEECVGGFKVGERSYPDPFDIMFTREQRPYTVSICHGDLNANNILCTDSGTVSFIDFQDTGTGHLFQDFAALEHSIRLFWNSAGAAKPRQKTLLAREERLAKGEMTNADAPSYAQVCHELRTIAKERFPDVEDWEYFYAACALSVKLTRLPGLSKFQLARLAACALVSTRRLVEDRG